MKKLGNLSLLALLAVGLALVFGGCRRDITAFGSPVTGVTIIDLDPDSGIPVGGTKQLFANVLPDNAINKDVTWRSENPDVAKVDKDGKVTGVAGGLAKITVVTDDGGFTARCEVRVEGNQGDSNPPGGGGDTDDPDYNDNAITVFDPAKYTGNAGKVVDKDGTKYLEITVDGYNTAIGLDPAVDLKGKTKFKAVMFGEKDNADLQFVVKLADADNGEISSITMASISKSPSEEEAGVSKKESWNTISETFLCAVIQPMVQDKTAGYGATSGNTVYIGKITAEGNGDTEKPSEPGDDKVITVFDPATYTGDAGEVVDGSDGAKYLKITVNGYGSTIYDINPVNLVGKTKFKCTMYGKEANANYIWKIKLADSENHDISNIEMNGIVTIPTERVAGVAEKEDWNEVSETFLCDRIQPMVQDSTDGYSEQYGVVVYIGKITAE